MSPRLGRRRSRVARRDTVLTVALVRDDQELARWSLVTPGRPDLALVDGLARLQLAARRLGAAIHLRDVGVELAGLLDLLGLGDVVTRAPGLGRQPVGEAEGGEQAGVEEVVVPDDPVA